jgi:hypothetical protein
MKPIRVSQPKNIRFDEATKIALLELADSFGVTCSDLIREAVKQKLPEWRSKGVILVARRLS